MKATRETIAERLATRLVRMPNGCLEWTGPTIGRGYGKTSVNSKTFRTHRVAWTLANGPIPDGLNVLHHCDNPPCCETNPTEGYPDGHLFLGTHGENNADRASKGRNAYAGKTHCPQRHELTEANTYVTPRGYRDCRECKRAANTRAYFRKHPRSTSC